MAFKLKDLKISKVDFVDEGANQQANIVLLKRKERDEGGGEEQLENPVRKFFSAIAKAVGLKDDDAKQAIEQITKSGAMTFSGKQGIMQQRRISSEIWDACNAIEDSLCSIMRDEKVVDKGALMKQSVDEFSTAIKGFIDCWAEGQPAQIKKESSKITPERAAELEVAKGKIEQMLKVKPKQPDGKEVEEEQNGLPKTTPKKMDKIPCATKKNKGDDDEMKIDKSKLTAEELVQLEAIEKKAGVQEESEAGEVNKAATAPPNNAEPDKGEDIYKGLHPAVAVELKELRKRADAAEERELEEVAKKYEIIGKKKEELVPILKELKAAGGNAYASMIATLDSSVELVEKSGMFSDIGKRGVGTNDADKAWTSIEKKAEEIRKAKPDMNMTEAIDIACQQNPELVQQYEGNR